MDALQTTMLTLFFFSSHSANYDVDVFSLRESQIQKKTHQQQQEQQQMQLKQQKKKKKSCKNTPIIGKRVIEKM